MRPLSDPISATPPGRNEGKAPPALAEVEVIEQLGQRLPLDLVFTDDGGAAVRLGELLQEGRPAVLSLVYYRCPTLCGMVMNGLVGSLRQTGLRLGEDYSVISVSIDPTEGPEVARAKKTELLAALGPGAPQAWSVLTGQEPQLRQLAQAVGFGYGYDEKLRVYAHAAVLIVIAPDGKVSRYLYGVRYPPREMRLALVEAAGGKVGTAFDRFLLTCYQYDPATRRYEPYIRGFLRLGGLTIFAALATTLGIFWRREWAKKGKGR